MVVNIENQIQQMNSQSSQIDTMRDENKQLRTEVDTIKAENLQLKIENDDLRGPADTSKLIYPKLPPRTYKLKVSQWSGSCELFIYMYTIPTTHILITQHYTLIHCL